MTSMVLLGNKKYPTHDRDLLFTREAERRQGQRDFDSSAFRRDPPKLSTYAERLVRSIRESCLDRTI